MNDTVIGKEVDGYRIQSVLGRGGMGTVYKAKDINLSRTVAIKRINPAQSDREAFIHRFRSEAQALARIDSPHIVGVYALRETDIGLLIVMEYVEGGTLKDPLDRDGAMAPKQAIPILEQNLHAFHDAHSAGVIHRDIKPQNIMLTKDGMVKVTDFGIAKLRQPDSGETVTQGGQGGTLKYMSPEQISSIDDVDARSDLYSLGMTAYEMLSGSLPFTETDTDFDIMRKVVEGEIPPPDEYNSDIPSGLAQWVVGAIQKDQDDRYQSAQEMLKALQEANKQVDVTVTQPDWEVDDGSADVDETHTVPPDGPDQTQTVLPGGEQGGDAGSVDPTGQTMMDPQAAVHEGDDAEGTSAPTDDREEGPSSAGDDGRDEKTSWVLVGGGVIGGLLVLVAGYFALAQFGGSSAQLSLTTAPSGAEVFVNGDRVGTTPLDGRSVEAGTVHLRLAKAGFSSLDTTLQVDDGEEFTLADVALAEARTEGTVSPATADAASGGTGSGGDEASETSPSEEASSESEEQAPPATADRRDAGAEEESTGIVTVRPQPRGTVLVDGTPQDVETGIPLTVGTHTITCEHPDFGSVEKTVEIEEGQTQTLTCYFTRDVLVNTSSPPFGRIWLNQTDTGKNTPSTLSLPPGTHRVSLRRNTLDNFRVNGGNVRTVRGSSEDISGFSGNSFEITVEPTFTKVEHALIFKVEGG